MWPLQQLVQFRAVYEHDSLSAAARALGMSQPALSHSLSKLEARVGGALFQRHTRSLRPTELARALYKQAGRVLDEVAGLDLLVARFHEGRSGLVRIGCGPFAPDILGQSLAGPLRREGSGIRLDLHADQFDALQEGLYAYRYDFLVYDRPQLETLADQADTVVQPLRHLPLRVVASAAWVRGEKEPVGEDPAAARAFMARMPWALPIVPMEYRQRLSPWFQALLEQRKGAEYQMAAISSCLALCRAGQAITVAPDLLIEADIASGHLLTLPLDTGVRVDVSACRLRSHPLSDAAARVWQLLGKRDSSPWR